MGISKILAIIALVCGVLLLIPGAWSTLPLAAIAIICLALTQTGFLARIR
ncbi:MAG: hypothetical protein ACRDGT_05460 [Candidatus Limnocylindria bacterium]